MFNYQRFWYVLIRGVLKGESWDISWDDGGMGLGIKHKDLDNKRWGFNQENWNDWLRNMVSSNSGLMEGVPGVPKIYSLNCTKMFNMFVQYVFSFPQNVSKNPKYHGWD